jgi:hypothetical protein
LTTAELKFEIGLTGIKRKKRRRRGVVRGIDFITGEGKSTSFF